MKFYPDTQSNRCCLLGSLKFQVQRLEEVWTFWCCQVWQALIFCQKLLANLRCHIKADLSEGPFGFDLSWFAPLKIILSGVVKPAWLAGVSSSNSQCHSSKLVFKAFSGLNYLYFWVRSCLDKLAWEQTCLTVWHLLANLQSCCKQTRLRGVFRSKLKSFFAPEKVSV